MTRNRKRPSDIDVFENHNTASPKANDEAIFGAFANVDTGKPVVRLLDIFDIQPDATQPRRVIPSAVLGYRAESPAEMFNMWVKLASQERGTPFQLDAYLQTSDEVSRNEQAGPVESALLEVVKLAASILRDGLTNPITVIQVEQVYFIETGERRWLAYHLLYSTQKEPNRWQHIPAQVVQKFNRFRQASENNARANLNAIGKARQYSLLLMEIIGSEKFPPYEAFATDRQFYAQMAVVRVPSGKNELLMNGLGITSRSALTRYRAILSLPDAVWQLGDDHNFSEETLEKLSQLPPEVAIVKAQEIVLGPNNFDRSLSNTVEYAPGSKRYLLQLSRTIRDAEKGDDIAQIQAIKMIIETRRWLEEVERRISDASKRNKPRR